MTGARSGITTPTQTLCLGRYADAIKAGVERLVADRFLPRLWERDATLWSPDRAVREAIGRRLGWLSIADVMGKELADLRRFASEIRAAGSTHAVLLGMGGSALFPEVCRALFGVAPGSLDLAILDTTDSTAIRERERARPLRDVLVVVSSKSGTTSETAALASYFYEALERSGEDAGTHCIAITDAGTPLDARSRAWKFRRVFAHVPGQGVEVGGRFSALTYFGLVPAALLGVDLERLVRRAQEMFARCGPAAPAAENPALQLGAALATLAQAGRDKVTLLCAPPLASFGAWAEQLLAENLGKQGQGLVPIDREPLRDPLAYGPDRVFIELQVAGSADPALDRLVPALVDAGHPVIRLRWQDPYDVGSEAVKWFVASAAIGRLVGINPFDEPNVQESKDRTRALLDAYTRERRLPEPEPHAIVERLAPFLRQRREHDYVAVLSFLPRTPTLDRGVQALREKIGERLGCATLAQFGPRYLHSTGQLFKGGPDHGLFLLLTASESQDLPIPGEPFTFGILKEAQALGDFQAMRERNRRILRVHFTGAIERSLQRLIDAIEERTKEPGHVPFSPGAS